MIWLEDDVVAARLLGDVGMVEGVGVGVAVGVGVGVGGGVDPAFIVKLSISTFLRVMN